MLDHGYWQGRLPLTYHERDLVPISNSPYPDSQGMNWIPVTINGSEYALMRYNGQFRLVDLRDIPEALWDSPTYAGSEERRLQHYNNVTLADTFAISGDTIANIRAVAPKLLSFLRTLNGPLARKIASRLNWLLINGGGEFIQALGYSNNLMAMTLYLKHGQKYKAMIELTKLLANGGADILGLGVSWRMAMAISSSLLDSGYFVQKIIRVAKAKKKRPKAIENKNQTKRF